MKNSSKTVLILLTLATTALTGCLKTRAQLREDASEERVPAAYKAVPAQPAQEIPSQYAVDEIKVTLTQLEGRIQDLEKAHQESKGNSSAKKLETRVQQLEVSLAALAQSHTSVEQGQAALAAALKELQDNPALSNPDEIFKKAKAQFDGGDYTAATESFAAYLKIPRAKKIEDATYMRASSFFKLKQYKNAIVDFSKFPEKFSKSPRTPEAMYKIGLSFDALDMKEDARGFYQEIVEKYPKSPEAKKAKKKAK
ncbi:MAG: tetratricopeptide repeat protein [Bdellovibrionia bacterium]